MPASRGTDRYRTSDAAQPADALVGRPDWQRRAACRDAAPGTFAGTVVTPDVARMCGDCAVRLLCLRSAVERGEAGVWAGTTERDRRAMADELKAARVAEGTPRRRAVPGLNARRRR